MYYTLKLYLTTFLYANAVYPYLLWITKVLIEDSSIKEWLNR